MPDNPRCRWLVILTLIAGTSIGSAITAAQLLSGGNGTPPNETIQIQTGNILEILPIHSFPSATYSWILTQDRNFLEVGRNAFYSTRLINPGRFTLNAEVSTPTGPVLRRVFAIDVQPRQSAPLDNSTIPTPAPLTPTSLVRTQPEKREDGLIILPPNQVLLLLTPLRDDLRPLHIDFHSQNDTNDDDILTNDIDNAGTFFQTSGTPLYLWFTSPLEQRDITVHASTTDGTALTQTLSVLSSDYAKQRGLFVSRVQISTEERGPKSLFFSPKFEDSGTPAIPLLFHWDFGDGTESIEERPLHEYQTYGTYNVHLSIRNIETGQELAARTAAIPLRAPLIQDPNTILPSPSLPPDPPPPPPSTSFLRTALIILGIAVGFTAIGFIAAWVVHTVKRLLRKRREVQVKEESKKILAPTTPTVPTLPTIPTAPTTSSSPPPSSSGSGTPSWLKKGPPTAPPPVPTAPTIPPPKPQQPAPLSPPTPPEPTSPKPATPLPPPPLLPPAAPSVPLKVPPPEPPAPPQPKSSTPPPKPPKPATPAPPPLPPPQPTPALPTIQPPISKNPMSAPVPILKPPASRPLPPFSPPLAPLLPTPAEESKENIDRTIAIVQADNLQKPTIPPTPPGSQTKLQ